jgi:hypothetical protein
MAFKETIKGFYYRTRGPMAYIGSIAGLALLFVWLLSVLDIRIPVVDVEPQVLLSLSQFFVIYMLLWLAVRYRQKYRVTKLKLDARESESVRQISKSEKAHTNRPSSTQVVQMPRAPVPNNAAPSAPKGRTLLKRTIVLRRDEITDYRVKVRIGSTLEVRMKSSSPVNVFLVDEWHYNREDYDNPEDEESDALVAEFRIKCKKNCYYLTIMNEGQKNAQIDVESSQE